MPSGFVMVNVYGIGDFLNDRCPVCKMNPYKISCFVIAKDKIIPVGFGEFFELDGIGERIDRRGRGVALTTEPYCIGNMPEC